MTNIEIGMKNGDKIRFSCKDWEVTYSKITGKIENFNFNGAIGSYPIYIDIAKILYICMEKKD